MFGVCDVTAAPSGAQQDRDNIGQPLGKTPHSIRARSRLRALSRFTLTDYFLSRRFDTGPRLRSPPKQMTFEFLLPRNTGKTVPRRCNLSFSPYFLFLSVSRSFVGDITIRKGKSGVHVQGLNRVLTNHVDPRIRTRLPDTLEYTLHTVTRALVLSCYGFERTGGTFIFL